jgi:hypothetical protein
VVEKLLHTLTVLKGAPTAPIVRGGKREWRATESREVHEHNPTIPSEQLAELSNRFKGTPPSVEEYNGR